MFVCFPHPAIDTVNIVAASVALITEHLGVTVVIVPRLYRHRAGGSSKLFINLAIEPVECDLFQKQSCRTQHAEQVVVL